MIRFPSGFIAYSWTYTRFNLRRSRNHPPRRALSTTSSEEASSPRSRAANAPKSTVRTSRKFLVPKENRRKSLEEIGSQLKIRVLSDWYQIGANQVFEHGGETLLRKYYRGSLSYALKDLFPEHKWQPWLFANRPRAVWRDDKTRREFFDWISSDVLRLKSMEDWYDVTYESLETALNDYQIPITALRLFSNGSLVAALKDAYHSHEWQEWRFKQVPRGFWASRDSRLRYFNWVAQKLDITNLSDWYKINYQQVAAIGANGVLQTQYNSSLSTALRDLYPDHTWQDWKFTWSPSSANDRQIDSPS